MASTDDIPPASLIHVEDPLAAVLIKTHLCLCQMTFLCLPILCIAEATTICIYEWS
jgi:hypothetical protein